MKVVWHRKKKGVWRSCYSRNTSLSIPFIVFKTFTSTRTCIQSVFFGPNLSSSKTPFPNPRTQWKEKKNGEVSGSIRPCRTKRWLLSFLWSLCSVWRLSEGEEQLKITFNKTTLLPCLAENTGRKTRERNKASQSSAGKFWSQPERAACSGCSGEWQRSQDTLLLNDRWCCQGL